MMAMDWQADLDKGLEAAAAAKQPVLIDFWRMDCEGCERLAGVMSTVPEVVRELANFTCVSVNIGEQPKVARRFDLVWTPTLLTLHYRGTRIRETTGYMPARELLPELWLARGLFEMRRMRYEEAIVLFKQVDEAYPASAGAPEAMFWRGWATRQQTGSKEVMNALWHELIARYPDSLWSDKTTLKD